MFLLVPEWKRVPAPGQRDEQIRQARIQANRYSLGIFRGLEARPLPIPCLVSKDSLDMPLDDTQDDVVYRHINIAVDPQATFDTLKLGAPFRARPCLAATPERLTVQQAAQQAGRQGGMDLTGRHIVVWLSPEAIETFLGVLEPAQERGATGTCGCR
jgi:hypothetical protein